LKRNRGEIVLGFFQPFLVGPKVLQRRDKGQRWCNRSTQGLESMQRPGGFIAGLLLGDSDHCLVESPRRSVVEAEKGDFQIEPWQRKRRSVGRDEDFR